MRRGAAAEVSVLTTGDARKLGLFGPFATPQKLDIPHTVWVEYLPPNTLRFYCPRDVEIAQEFPMQDNRMWMPTEIQFSTTLLHFGERFYFLCPYDNKRCTKLFFYKGIVASGRAFKSALAALGYFGISRSIAEKRRQILGLAHKGRWTAHNRQQFIDDLEKLEGFDRKMDDRLDTERRKIARREAKSLWESMPRSTTKALDEGQGLAGFHWHEALLQCSESWLVDPQPGKQRPHPGPSGSVADYRELDIRILIDRGVFEGARPTSRRLWGLPLSPNTPWIILHIVPVPNDMPFAIVEFASAEGASEFQRLLLAPGSNPGRPRRFVCPVTGLQVDVLYLRESFFASRQAHGLRFPKEGKKGFSSALSR